MGRWTYEDEDSYRLPEGFTRIAYDADSRVYTYRDEEGRLHEGAPGASYGLLRPLAAPPKSTRNERVQTAPVVDRNKGRWAAATGVDVQEAGRAVSSTPSPQSAAPTIRKTRDTIPPTTAGTTSRRATMPARSNRVTRSTSDGVSTPRPSTSTTRRARGAASPTTNSPSGGPSARDSRVARSSSGGAPAPEPSLPKSPTPKSPTPKQPATKAHKTPRTTSSPSGGPATAMSRRATTPARSYRIADSTVDTSTSKPPTTTRETHHPTPHTPPATSSHLGESSTTKSKRATIPLGNDRVTGSASVESSFLKSKSSTVKSPTKTMHKRSHTTPHTPPTNSSPSGGSPTTASRRTTIPPRNNRDGSHTLESSLPKSKSSTTTIRERRHTTSRTPPTDGSPPDRPPTRYERGTILPRNIRRLLGALGIIGRRRNGQP